MMARVYRLNSYNVVPITALELQTFRPIQLRLHMIKGLPPNINKALVQFLADIEVEKLSPEWDALQVAITMLIMPKKFKETDHVYLESIKNAMDPYGYTKKEIIIKIWPSKVQMRYINQVYQRGEDDYRVNEKYRYIYPNEKYNINDFNILLESCGFFACSNYSQSGSYADGNFSVSSRCSITTNVK